MPGVSYTCFVDFQKAYDTVWREGLLHKLERIGISGKVLSIINSMYNKPKSAIYSNGKISENFQTTVGVKQGDVLSTLLFNIFINDLPNEFQKLKTTEEVVIFNEIIHSLLFADDLIILSLNKEDLQTKLDTLNEYCLKWGLKVNTKKTKVMIFNKAGATIKKHKLKFQGNTLETASAYTYLGFVFVPSGKPHAGIENLVNKARKAWFTIQRSLLKSKEKTVNTYLKLFDTIVKPILLYGCETWGDISTKKLFESKVEKLHLSVCKQVLGVNKRANNVCTFSELGRYPLFTNIEAQVFKYFQRFIYVDKDRLLYKAFQENCSLDIGGNEGWISSIKKKLDLNGQTNMWKDILMACKSDELKTKYKNKLKHFNLRIKDVFLQTKFFVEKEPGYEQVSPIAKFKKEYKSEKYLQIKRFESRQALAKLRVGNNALLVERSKWYDIDKLCKQCNLNVPENDFHFVFDCPKYNSIRRKTFGDIFEKDKIDLNLIKDRHELENVFNDASLYSLNQLGCFVEDCFKIREIDANYHYIIIF